MPFSNISSSKFRQFLRNLSEKLGYTYTIHKFFDSVYIDMSAGFQNKPYSRCGVICPSKCYFMKLEHDTYDSTPYKKYFSVYPIIREASITSGDISDKIGH